MNFIRKMLVALGASLFTLVLFSIASVVAFNQTFGKPDQVKTWVAESGAYDNFVEVALQELQKTSTEDLSDTTLPIDNPDVQAVVKEAFPAQLIQQSAESFIDGSYNWLEGEVAQPDFRIDLTDAKTNLATGLAEYARNRYNNLPVCALNDIPESFDPFTIACQVPGYDVEPEIQRLTQEFATSKEFLGNPVITADTLQPDDEQGQTTTFQNIQGMSTGYQLAATAPYVLGALAVILAIFIIFVSRNHRYGIRRVAIALAITGVLLILSGYLADAISNWGSDTLLANQSINPLIQESLTSLSTRFSAVINQVHTQFGIGYLIAAALILIVLLATRRASWFAKKKVMVAPTDPDPDAVTNSGPLAPAPESTPGPQPEQAAEPTGPPPVKKQ